MVHETRAEQGLESACVASAGVDVQPVARLVSSQGTLVEPPPQSRDLCAQRNAGISWELVGPQLVDEAVSRNGLVRMYDQHREQQSLLLARETRGFAIVSPRRDGPEDAVAQRRRCRPISCEYVNVGEAVAGQRPDVFRPSQIGQGHGPQLDKPSALWKMLGDERCGGAAHQHLATLGDPTQPGDSIDRRSEVVVVVLDRLSGMDRETDGQASFGGPLLGHQCELCSMSGANSVSRTEKHRERRIALATRFQHQTAMDRDGGGDQLVVARRAQLPWRRVRFPTNVSTPRRRTVRTSRHPMGDQAESLRHIIALSTDGAIWL